MSLCYSGVQCSLVLTVSEAQEAQSWLSWGWPESMTQGHNQVLDMQSDHAALGFRIFNFDLPLLYVSVSLH